jgi:hypothetical protein
VDWIGLAQDREKCRALVNALMNLRVLYSAGKRPSGFTSSDLSSSAIQLERNCFTHRNNVFLTPQYTVTQDETIISGVHASCY